MFFSSVNVKMFGQAAFIREFHFAVFTLERLLSSVNSKMSVQRAFLSEFISTEITFESLQSSVSYKVLGQSLFVSEFLFTKITYKRLFSSVNFDMGLQMAALRKSLITTITLESFSIFKIFQLVFNHVDRFSFFNQLKMVELRSRLHLKKFVPRGCLWIQLFLKW